MSDQKGLLLHFKQLHGYGSAASNKSYIVSDPSPIFQPEDSGLTLSKALSANNYPPYSCKSRTGWELALLSTLLGPSVVSRRRFCSSAILADRMAHFVQIKQSSRSRRKGRHPKLTQWPLSHRVTTQPLAKQMPRPACCSPFLTNEPRVFRCLAPSPGLGSGPFLTNEHSQSRERTAFSHRGSSDA